MMRFFDFLFPPRTDESVLRTISDDEFLHHLSPHIVSMTRPESITLLPFSTVAVRAALHEAKYHGSARAFKLLALVLCEYLRDAEDIGQRTTLVRLIPVPLGDTRRKERGFNQVEEVIKIAAAELSLTVDSTLLTRTRDTVSQVSLPREKREENMRGAFTVKGSVNPRYTYLLIDDVLTTGATLQAAIRALEEAGATDVLPLTFAH